MSNRIDFSSLKEFYSENPFYGFSIKYVIEGCEKYIVNGKKFSVNSNEFLLANQFSVGSGLVHSKENVIGVCIDVQPSLISEVLQSIVSPNNSEFETGIVDYFTSEQFFENKFTTQDSVTGKFLHETKFFTSQLNDFSNEFAHEFYYRLAQNIVLDHAKVFKNFSNIKAIKTTTKKDLYRKLLHARDFIYEGDFQELNISNISKHCGISEFHFYRLFKLVFGYSPLQYILNRKLELAHKAILNNNESIISIALNCGFADLASFSKAFKKRFGVAPSLLKANYKE
jgi:AraC family transcriptional regulator